MSEEKDPIKSLSKRFEQPLVKSWKLKSSLAASPDEKLGLYVDPHRGIFYARIPEEEYGTLYAGFTLDELREKCRPAYKAWLERQKDLEGGQREWERCIRIRYEGGQGVLAELVTAKSSTMSHGEWATRNPHDTVECLKVGAFTYARFERSLQPEGRRWDEREWEEDFEARMDRWRRMTGPGNRFTQEQARRMRPERKRCVSWVKQRFNRNEPKPRVVPWDPVLWKQLKDFTERFSMLHANLVHFMLEADEATFLEGMAGNQLLLEAGEG